MSQNLQGFPRTIRPIASVVSLFLFVLLAFQPSRAQTITDLLDFNGTNGANPFYGTLAQGRDGKLYGTTYYGGANSAGTVYRLNPANNLYSILHSFDGTNGSYPGAGLTLASDGNFYGATLGGGSSQFGVLYQLNPNGTYTVLHNFLGGADGGYPYGPPIEASDGNLYGTTSGDVNGDSTTIYEYTRSGQYNIIYTFDSATTGNIVYGLMQGGDNLLYVTSNRGGLHGCGAISKITLTGIVKATHGFNCRSGGGDPLEPPIQATDGNYYGGTQSGGSFQGVLYRINASNFGENVIYDFPSAAIFEPASGLVQASDGNLYGVTFGGQGGSHLYSWSFTGGFTDLGAFPVTTESTQGLLQNTNGLFYGTSWVYGPDNSGYIYSIDMGLSPFITFVRAQGKVGSTAQILGNGLTGTTSVTFNGVPASFAVVSDTYLTATVPTGATTGPVVVDTSTGALNSNKSFKVTQ